MLAEHFLETSRVRLGLRQLSMEPATLRALLDYDWPGNVRELEHVILRGALRAGSRSGPVVLCPADLDGVAARTRQELPHFPAATLAAATADFQGQCIRHRLIEHQGNWSETARSLGLDRSNLHRLARRLGIK